MTKASGYWLAVESYENWLADKQAGFQYYGVSTRKIGVANTVRAGDVLVMYVSSGRSCISDARTAVSDGLGRIGAVVDYDRPFSVAIKTQPLVVLSEEAWIPFRDLVPRLAFVSSAGDWRPYLLNSLRTLSVADGQLLTSELHKKAG